MKCWRLGRHDLGYNRFLSFLKKFFNVYLLLKEREREHEQGRGRERGRERIPSRLHVVNAELDVGLNLTNREIMT